MESHVNFILDFDVLSIIPDAEIVNNQIAKVENLLAKCLEPKFSMGSKLLSDDICNLGKNFSLDNLSDTDDICINQLKSIFIKYITELNSDKFNEKFNINFGDEDSRALFWVDNISGIYYINGLFHSPNKSNLKSLVQKTRLIHEIENIYVNEGTDYAATFLINVDIFIKHFPIGIINI